MASLPAAPAMQTSLYFLKRSPLHIIEKPYTFKFPPADGFQQSNFESELIKNVPITDIRGIEDTFTLEKNGFAVWKVESGLSYDEFHDKGLLKKYFALMENLLKERLGPSMVKVFRYTIRKRHPVYPISTGETYQYDQPTTVVHIDTTPSGTDYEFALELGDSAPDLLKKRHQWIKLPLPFPSHPLALSNCINARKSVWKPLKGPTNDWPLLLCDASTVSPEDLEPSDLLYPKLATENSQVYWKDGFRWYWLSEHEIDEVVVFLQSDSRGKLPGVPHCSFANEKVRPGELPRESIEVRAMLFYD